MWPFNKKKSRPSPNTYLKFWISPNDNVEIRLLSKDKNMPHVVKLLGFLADNVAFGTVMNTIIENYPKEVTEKIIYSVDSLRKERYKKSGITSINGPVVPPVRVFNYK